MKKLILIIGLLLMTTAPHANELNFMGGVVESKDHLKMALVCELEDADQKCEEIAVYRDHGYGLRKFATLTRISVDEVATQARRNASGELNSDYTSIALAGTMVGGGFIWVTNGHPLSVGVLVAGGALDIIKAPVVGAAFIFHKVTDIFAKRRMKKLIKFMLDKEKVGQTKFTRERYFEALEDVFWN